LGIAQIVLRRQLESAALIVCVDRHPWVVVAFCTKQLRSNDVQTRYFSLRRDFRFVGGSLQTFFAILVGSGALGKILWIEGCCLRSWEYYLEVKIIVRIDYLDWLWSIIDLIQTTIGLNLRAHFLRVDDESKQFA